MTQFLTTLEDTKSWLDAQGVQNYKIHSDLTVDVEGGVDLTFKNLKYFPVQFSRVSQSFYCSFNHLTSLLGAPCEVGGTFNCSRNSLTSLRHGPQSVGGSFFCDVNHINTFEYGPMSVGDNFSAADNPIKNKNQSDVMRFSDFWDMHVTYLSIKRDVDVLGQTIEPQRETKENYKI